MDWTLFFCKNDWRRGRQKKKMKRKTSMKNKSKTTIGFLDLKNPMLETNFNFLCALDQKLWWKTCFRVMADTVNVIAYVARTDRSRFYCRILCPRIRSTLCKNMVTFCPAASELEAKLSNVTLNLYRSRSKVNVTIKLNHRCAMMPVAAVWSFKTASSAVFLNRENTGVVKRIRIRIIKKDKKGETSWLKCVMKDARDVKVNYTFFVDFLVYF